VVNRHDDERRAGDSRPYLWRGFRKWPDLSPRNQWIRFVHRSRATLEAIFDMIKCVHLYLGILEVALQAKFTFQVSWMLRRAEIGRGT
jgi:hypothetical protein